MKNMKNFIIAVLALVLAFACTACGGSTDSEEVAPINIAFVLGIADGETKVNEGINELSILPTLPGTDYAFISAEGNPITIGEPGTIPDLSDNNYNDVMMQRVQASIKADLLEQLTAYEPASAEIDIAASTERAVYTLNAHATEDRQNILVYYCGGKSTTGLINMVETPIYKIDIEASIPVIAEKMCLDMSSIDEVIWYCCGNFWQEGQSALSASEKEKMRDFYEQLFYALGAKKVTFKDDLPSAEYYHFADTPVSCMEVEGTTSALKELVVLEPNIFKGADETIFEAPIVIPESQVQYLPDSDDFLDPDAAAAAIEPVADFLLEHEELNILLYGTCAGDVDTATSLWLGRARAASVMDILLAAGVDKSRITVVTTKNEDDPYYQFGLGTGPEASVNRKTVMMDLSTDLAQQLLSNAQ